MMSPSGQNIERLIRSVSLSRGNPYAFAVRRLVAPKAKRPRVAASSERDMVREQHRTLFEYDEAMQELFGGDFEEYFRVIENPELLAEGAEVPEHGELEDALSEAGDAGEADDAFMFEDDPLYCSAAAWANRLHELGHLIYDRRGQHDPDIFRVTINALLVSSKIAYALDIDEEELAKEDVSVYRAELEISIRAYTLANIFLQRVRESLKRLERKRIAPVGEWERALQTARSIASEIASRVLALSRTLHHGAN